MNLQWVSDEKLVHFSLLRPLFNFPELKAGREVITDMSSWYVSKLRSVLFKDLKHCSTHQLTLEWGIFVTLKLATVLASKHYDSIIIFLWSRLILILFRACFQEWKSSGMIKRLINLRPAGLESDVVIFGEKISARMWENVANSVVRYFSIHFNFLSFFRRNGRTS